MKLRGKAFSWLLKDVSVKRCKTINRETIVPAHAQSVVPVSKQYLLNAPIQLPRNMEEHATAHFTPYFAYFVFFVILQSVLYRESAQNWRFLFCGQTVREKHKDPWITK